MWLIDIIDIQMKYGQLWDCEKCITDGLEYDLSKDCGKLPAELRYDPDRDRNTLYSLKIDIDKINHVIQNEPVKYYDYLVCENEMYNNFINYGPSSTITKTLYDIKKIVEDMLSILRKNIIYGYEESYDNTDHITMVPELNNDSSRHYYLEKVLDDIIGELKRRDDIIDRYKKLCATHPPSW